MPILDHQSQIRELPYSSGYKEGGSRTDYKEDHAQTTRRITHGGSRSDTSTVFWTHNPRNRATHGSTACKP